MKTLFFFLWASLACAIDYNPILGDNPKSFTNGTMILEGGVGSGLGLGGMIACDTDPVMKKLDFMPSVMVTLATAMMDLTPISQGATNGRKRTEEFLTINGMMWGSSGAVKLFNF